MTETILPKLDETTGRLAPGGAPLHDDLDGLTHHAPSALGQDAGLMPQTNGDGTYTLVPAPTLDPATSEGRILAATKVTTGGDRTPAASTTGADYDTAVVAVTFSVPDSGNVTVDIDATHAASTENGNHYWQLRQAGSVVSEVQIGGATKPGRTHATMLVTDLTPGQNLTWTLAVRQGSANGTSTLKVAADSPVVIIVRDAPF